MLVDFNFKHLDTIYPIRSMMIWHFFTNNMTKYRNLTPLTHYFHFILFHAVSVKISFNYLPWRASLFCLSKFNILCLFLLIFLDLAPTLVSTLFVATKHPKIWPHLKNCWKLVFNYLRLVPTLLLLLPTVFSIFFFFFLFLCVPTNTIQCTLS